MSWIKRLASTLRGQRLEAELDRELEFHVAMRAREKAGSGLPPEEARRLAEQRFGSMTRTREACREASTLAWVTSLGQDFRYAARNLAKHPGFAAAAAACLAIGIGANTAVFSFVNAFLFPGLPPRAVLIQRASGTAVSYPELQDWRTLSPVFDEVFAYTPGARLSVGRGAGSTQALGEAVTANYFHALGIVPAAGRLFAPVDETRPVAVLGHAFWRSHFSGNPAVVGQSVWINQEAFTIVGIAPASFAGMLAPWSTDVWVTPYLQRAVWGDRRNGWLAAAGRLKAGVLPQQAAAALNALDQELAKRYPDPGRRGPDPLTLARRSGLSGSPVWAVFLAMSVLLMAVSGIIFLISCGNVAGLLMARATVRRREILIRLSLGAGRARLMRQLLTESLLMALLGGAGGVIVAFASGDALAGLMPRSITGGFRFQHGIDGTVLGFTLLMAVAGVIVSGLLPAVRASDQNLAAAGRSHSTAGSRTPVLRQWLIVGQVAASVLVLATAGVFVRNFQKTLTADPGFDAAHLVTVKLDLRDLHYTLPRNSELYEQLRDRVAALPGVAAVSLAELLPLGDERSIEIPGQVRAGMATVDSQYFHAMGIPLLRGREPVSGEANAIVVNEALARRLWPGQDPIGRTVRLAHDSVQVVGMTANGRYWSLNEPPRPFLYRESEHPSAPQYCLAVRTAGPPQALTASISREIERLNPDLPAMPALTEGDRLRLWLEPQRASAVLLSILGLAALGLAITGLYALLAQLVVQRAQEIAVRVVLGASRLEVARVLLGRSALLLSAGGAAGLAASAASSRLLAAIAGPVPALDPVILGGIALLLAVVGTAATLFPAYRATRIAPAVTLKSD